MEEVSLITGKNGVAKHGLTSLKLPKEEKVSILKTQRNTKIFGAIWKNLVFAEWHENFEAFGISRYAFHLFQKGPLLCGIHTETKT